MNETQRAAAERLVAEHPTLFMNELPDWCDDAFHLLRELLAEPQGEPVASATSCVICPKCCHQFRAIPQDVQRLMLDAGFEPPFTHPPQQRKPLTHMQAVLLWGHRSDGPSTAEIVSFARAVERSHGITGEPT